MLKSSLIKLRRQPKGVREQFALMAAGVFTFAVFGIWAFTLPERFEGVGAQTAGVATSFTESVQEDEITFEEVSESLRPVTQSAPETTEEQSVTYSSTTEASAEAQASTIQKEVRIITTSSTTNLQQ